MMQSAITAGIMAAGIGFDLFAQAQADRLSMKGEEVDTAAMNANLEMLRLQSAQQGAKEMGSLRQSIGSQIAANAAMGTASYGVGQIAKRDRQIGQAERGEKIRKLNLNAQELQLRQQNLISGLHGLQQRQQAGRKLVDRIFDTIPTMYDVFDQDAKSTKMGGGAV